VDFLPSISPAKSESEISSDSLPPKQIVIFVVPRRYLKMLDRIWAAFYLAVCLPILAHVAHQPKWPGMVYKWGWSVRNPKTSHSSYWLMPQG
jgi:hypothetical protein